MKRSIVFLALIFCSITLFSYTWVSFSPETINANNICFGVGSWKGVICTDEGMYLWEDDILEWSFYTYGLPVTGAAYLDNEKILVTMGNGSFSDGVYTFHLETKQFEVVKYIANPNFLLHYYPNNSYYIGSQFGGMYYSVSGAEFLEIPYFTGKSCTAMDYYDSQLVVSEVSNIYNVYISDDLGATWQEATGSIPMLTDIKFSYYGDLLGIFPSYSNSSGLWRSGDFGQTWEVEFWSDNMSSVGFDAMGNIFVGWESPTPNNEGIAIYTPGTVPPNLAYLNDGLPSTNINKILLNPSMSAIAIFCCTDQGVWICYDYMVGEDNPSEIENSISIYPNPFTDILNIEFVNNEIETTILEIFSMNGESHLYREFQNQPNLQQSISWNPGSDGINLSEGIYLVKITQGSFSTVQKVIYSR